MCRSRLVKLGQIKHKCVLGNMSKTLGRVGKHLFSGKYIILCILKGISSFKMHKIIYFSRKPEKILGFSSKFKKGRVTLNTGIIFYLALS